MEAAFRDVLEIDAKQEAGILPVRAPVTDDVLEAVNS
jgi:hypothetical protein